ncbi:MAG TPA: glycosyltransferase [Bacteroides sp.]|nr:glycosyltransferase [Bacteroides sp.]
MFIIWIISLSLLLVYFLRIVSYLKGWNRSLQTVHGADDHKGISLVIPVRNEESNIDLLINDLILQDYPEELLELIIVDDHSNDNTCEIVRSRLAEHPGLRLLELDISEQGKKTALHKGILSASHRIILNTDGDCRIEKNWVSGMVKGFSDPGIRMITGAVLFEPCNGIFRGMQSLEFLSLTAVTAGAVGLKSPILCNAANLAYYREDYLRFTDEQVRLSESGDDIFLMLWLKKQYPSSMLFSSVHGTIVRTAPSENLLSFAMQRLRWTSKSRFYRDLHMISTALLVYGLNAMIMFLIIASFRESGLILLTCLIFLGKSITDFLILLPVTRHYGKARLLRYFIPLEIIYFVYVSLIGLFGQIFSFTWKGRRIPVGKQYKPLG